MRRIPTKQRGRTRRGGGGEKKLSRFCESRYCRRLFWENRWKTFFCVRRVILGKRYRAHVCVPVHLLMLSCHLVCLVHDVGIVCTISFVLFPFEQHSRSHSATSMSTSFIGHPENGEILWHTKLTVPSSVDNFALHFVMEMQMVSHRISPKKIVVIHWKIISTSFAVAVHPAITQHRTGYI